MVNLFVTLIIKGKRTIDEVPTNLKEEVITKLNEPGYDESGTIL